MGIVGATAFTAAVCRTYSIVVIVFELLAVQQLILPLTLSTLASLKVANFVSPSIFDSVAAFKRLPTLVGRRAAWSFQAVGTEMKSDFKQYPLVLPRMCHPEDVGHILRRIRCWNSQNSFGSQEETYWIGLVEQDVPEGDGILLGTLLVKRLQRWFEELDQERSGVIDLLRVAADQKMLYPALQVEPHTTLKDACLLVQMMSHTQPHASLYVCDHCRLRGVITHHDLHLRLMCG